MDNSAQHAFWNGAAGEQWAEQDATMSRLLSPVSDMLMQSELLKDQQRVLNVGCGGGSCARHLMAVLPDAATVRGVDISEPLLAVARARLQHEPALANRLSFELADAGKDDLGDTHYDLVFSRFGVMFFAEPVVAFAHIRRHCAPGAKLLFACWQAPALNNWVTVPLQAALSILGPQPPTPPRAPGPFAFAEAVYARDVLTQAGWSYVVFEPREVTMRFGESNDLAASAKELLRTGPVGRLLVEAGQETRERVYSAVAAALAPYLSGEGLELKGAIWVVSAQNG